MGVRSKSSVGFSLFEVVIAVGIFAGAITVMLGLLPSMMRQSARAAETHRALGLPDPIRAELMRIARTGGFDALAARIGMLAVPVPETLMLTARADATVVQALDYQPPPAGERIPEGERYFLIEAWRFADPPLAFDVAGAALLLQVRVSWPYHVPNSTAITSVADREQITFNLALRR